MKYNCINARGENKILQEQRFRHASMIGFTYHSNFNLILTRILKPVKARAGLGTVILPPIENKANVQLLKIQMKKALLIAFSPSNANAFKLIVLAHRPTLYSTVFFCFLGLVYEHWPYHYTRSSSIAVF